MPFLETKSAASAQAYGLTSGVESYETTSILYDVPGTYSWVCPPGVTSVNVVVVGGGGAGIAYISGGSSGGGGALAWKNNIPVTPGTSYAVVVGAGGEARNTSSAVTDGSESYFSTISTVRASGGISAIAGNGGQGVGGSTVVGDGGGAGGTSPAAADGATLTGAGGAGGYTGNGGDGGNTLSGFIPGAGSGGGGGGGGGSGASDVSGAGGGVGVWGQGGDGAAGTNSTANGISGSSGSGGFNGQSLNPSSYNLPAEGKTYGGGGGSNDATTLGEYGNGGRGAVRIVYNSLRADSAFPASNVGVNVAYFQIVKSYAKWVELAASIQLAPTSVSASTIVPYTTQRVVFNASTDTTLPTNGSAQLCIPTSANTMSYNKALYLAVGDATDWANLTSTGGLVVMDFIKSGEKYSIGSAASFAGAVNTAAALTAVSVSAVRVARLVYWSVVYDCLVEVRPIDYQRTLHTTTLPELWTNLTI